jgi:hypothetical protein
MTAGAGEPPGAVAVARVWRRMAEIYGHRWTAQFGRPPARGLSPVMATWARGLGGLSAADLARGLDRVAREGDPWPPALPAFRALCAPRPADFGLPTAPHALEEALRRGPAGPWSHPAVGVAARAAFGRAWEGRAARDAGFLRAYRHVMERVMAGRPPEPPPPEVLGPPVEPAATPGEARRHLADLRAISRALPRADTGPGTDPKPRGAP